MAPFLFETQDSEDSWTGLLVASRMMDTIAIVNHFDCDCNRNQLLRSSCLNCVQAVMSKTIVSYSYNISRRAYSYYYYHKDPRRGYHYYFYNMSRCDSYYYYYCFYDYKKPDAIITIVIINITNFPTRLL